MTAPDGRRWTVRRLWLPRLRRRGSNGGDPGPWGLDPVGDVGDFGAAALAAIVLAIVVLVFLPYVFFLLELVVLPLVIAYRVVLRKPWTVEARGGSEGRRWRVVGWGRAGEVVDEIAHALERGDDVVARRKPGGLGGGDPAGHAGVRPRHGRPAVSAASGPLQAATRLRLTSSELAETGPVSASHDGL